MDSAVKDPNAILDYERDWGTWLESGDTILTSTWIVPVGLTMTDESNTTTVATVWLSGGAAGENYEITNRITTTQGRVDDRTIRIHIRER